jgi:hypothetical protein
MRPAARVALCLLWLTCLVIPARAGPGPFVIVLLPGTSLHDWEAADAPHLHSLMQTGSLAVMNTRTARLPGDRARETPQSALLTLGAGARAAGPSSAFFTAASHPDGLPVSFGNIYRRRMGLVAAPGVRVNPDWPRLLCANQGRGYDLHLGSLADTLEMHGIAIQAGGGSGSDFVAAAGGGTARAAATLSVQPGQCLVWDAGSGIPAADRALGTAQALVGGSGGRLLVLSPFAEDDEYAHGHRLTPILMWGPGVPAGLLLSPSTRRAGLVTNTDVAPTVANYFGLGVKDFVVRPFGQVIHAVPRRDPIGQVRSLEAQAVAQADTMRALPYVALALAAWVGFGTLLLRQARLPLLWPLVPPSLLLALLFSGSAPSVALYFLVALGLASSLAARRGAAAALLCLLAATAFCLLADMVTGDPLMRRSPLGYSAIEGARYYGIGNEAMGVLLGCLLVLAAHGWGVWGRRGMIGVASVFGLACLLLGSSWAGAKAGGLLASLTAFGAFLYTAMGRRWSVRPVLLLLLLVILGMAGFTAADLARPAGTHSHIGEAMARIQGGGVREAAGIAARKLAVESRLAYHSTWATLLWVGLGCLVSLRGRWPSRSAAGRALRVGGGTAIAASLALNDAGVVAGALCLVPLWCCEAARANEKPLQQ